MLRLCYTLPASLRPSVMETEQYFTMRTWDQVWPVDFDNLRWRRSMPDTINEREAAADPVLADLLAYGAWPMTAFVT